VTAPGCSTGRTLYSGELNNSNTVHVQYRTVPLSDVSKPVEPKVLWLPMHLLAGVESAPLEYQQWHSMREASQCWAPDLHSTTRAL